MEPSLNFEKHMFSLVESCVSPNSPLHSITFDQIVQSMLAIGAFLPASVCTGYVGAWITNLHGFRSRSLVERLFWSIPLSLAISPITLELTGELFSLSAASALLLACVGLCLATVAWDLFQRSRSGTMFRFGVQPLGGAALVVAVLWIALVILSLVDWESRQRLFMSATIYDHSARVNWTESVIRTGIPPTNSFYFYKHPAVMRNYYFWYIVVAAVARYSHLPVRAVFIASCVWAGFALAALCGLYLKHFLVVGDRLRRQFLVCVALLGVTGLDICANLWQANHGHRGLLPDLEWWSVTQITSWFSSLVMVPHHVGSLVCCMLAFLLARMTALDVGQSRIANIALMGAAMASAFGLSAYVAFAFFLVMLTWGIWQAAIERSPRPAFMLGFGAVGAALLLVPYLHELRAVSSGYTGATFDLAVREMIPPGTVLALPGLKQLWTTHPILSGNIADLILLIPGYIIELGFYIAVLAVYCVPSWRPRTHVAPASRSLLVISAATLLCITFLRSKTLMTNDFGWRGALILQFSLLLLGSELLTDWKDSCLLGAAKGNRNHVRTPYWLRSIAGYALCIGMLSTLAQVLMLRFYLPLVEQQPGSVFDPRKSRISHDAYIATIGYSKMNAVIPQDSIVQYNPGDTGHFGALVDLANVNHQTVSAKDGDDCGALLGGDPSGCPAITAAIDQLFKRGTADQARATCRQFGIQFLAVRFSDPAWEDKTGWVWTLKPVVADEEFRVLDCR
jgi:hypothetical protein